MENAVIEARTALQKRYGELPIPERSYLVLMAPRSGSNLLCVHLEKIGYGRPIEGFHFSLSALQTSFGKEVNFSDPYEHFKTVLNYGTLGGVFGLKLNWVEFEVFLQKGRELLGRDSLALNDAEVLEVFFPNAAYIHLKRRDKIKQAVSYARAMQNGIWKVGADQSDAYKGYILTAVYDREHIEGLFDNLLAFDLAWDQFLARNKIPALEILYEDLAKDYVNKMKEVYDFLGFERSEVIDPPLKKQSDSTSQEWVARFKSETAWLQDKTLSEALKSGDLETAYFQRTMPMVRQRERSRWEKMPASRFRNVRKFFIRVKNKLTR